MASTRVPTTTAPAGQTFGILTQNAGVLNVTLAEDTPGNGAQPAPTAGVDDGAVALAGTGASAGLLVYLKGAANTFLGWTGSTWAAIAARSNQILNDSGVVTTLQTVTDALNALGTTFRATLHVDPTFTGNSLGSESNPYKSITAAFAAGAALALTTGLVELAPGTTTTENVVFPTTGNWEVACRKSGGASAASATINGTIDFSTTGQVKHTLTSLSVTGAVTGNQTVTATPSRLYFTDVQFAGALTLTAATSRWRVWLDGKSNTGTVGEGGNTGGATTIAGEVYAWSWGFFGAVAWNTSSQFNNCNFGTNSLVNTAGANAVSFLGCFFGGAGTVTFTITAGSCTASFDGYSLSTIIGVGLVAAGVAGGLKVLNLVGVGSDQRSASANIGGVILSVKQPESLMCAECTLSIQTPGTAGVITPQISYTDLNGTAQTKSLLDQATGAAGALPVNAAAGTEIACRFYFSQNGASALTFNTTGITTAGALVYKSKVSVRQCT